MNATGVLAPAPGEALVVAVDTLVEAVHFPTGTPAADVGHKALAVNLSDLAAIGARPLAYSLSLALPASEPTWLADFDRGMGELAARVGVRRLATARLFGRRVVTVEVYGSVPPGTALRRSGARAGDGIFVSGTLGDAALALEALIGRRTLPADTLAAVSERLARPVARLDLGLALRGLASAAIDVSDGLASDLGHVLEASGVGATVELAALPLSPALAAAVEREDAWSLALAGGDDYELCFTAPAAREAQLFALGRRLGCPVSRVGTVEATAGLRCRDPSGRTRPAPVGYQHFADRDDPPAPRTA
jgi:thiamine-monophosphate kinase